MYGRTSKPGKRKGSRGEWLPMDEKKVCHPKYSNREEVFNMKKRKIRPEIIALWDRIEMYSTILFFAYMWLRVMLFVGGIDL